MRERGEAMGVRSYSSGGDGGGHDVSKLPQSLSENDREKENEEAWVGLPQQA